MGLLDYVDPDALRGKLKGLLGSMPVVQMAQGQAQMPTRAGLLSALREMPVFSPNAGESAYEAAMQIGPMGLGKIVYHGSPHKFDKFDASKIGTGEGAQAYGHGVYLADAEGVAKGYAENLKKYPVPEKLAELIPERKYFDPAEIGEFYSAARDSNISGKTLWNRNRTLRDIPPEKIQSAIDEIRKAGEGALYKADLPDEWIPKMLDWDKPVADLTVAEKKALQAAGARFADYWPNTQKVGDVLPKNERAAQSLQKAGIPGIRYLDGGSRGKGQGSYNYVVFPGLEDQVKILERNGVPLGLLGGK